MFCTWLMRLPAYRRSAWMLNCRGSQRTSGCFRPPPSLSSAGCSVPAAVEAGLGSLEMKQGDLRFTRAGLPTVPAEAIFGLGHTCGHNMLRRIVTFALILVLIYVGLGVGFHVKWKSALAACWDTRMAQGEFVEPEVFSGFIGLAFDAVFWPVYAAANIRLDGTPFATPCTH
jgi:hypothetical protein